jgi:sec-independent protein translocase protein TatB
MFDNLNFWEIGALLLLALFIFGPERLPKVIGDGLRMLRGMREMARNATRDLSREMGTDISLEDLHPKTFIRKHLLSEEEEAQMRRPFEDAYQDVKQITSDANDGWSESPPRPDDTGYDDGGTYRDRGPASSDNGYGDGGSGARNDGGSYGETGYGAGPYDSPSGAHPQHRNIDSDAT